MIYPNTMGAGIKAKIRIISWLIPNAKDPWLSGTHLNVAVVAGILLENVNTMRPKRKNRKGISELHSGIQPLPSMPLLSGFGKQLQF